MGRQYSPMLPWRQKILFLPSLQKFPISPPTPHITVGPLTTRDRKYILKSRSASTAEIGPALIVQSVGFFNQL